MTVRAAVLLPVIALFAIVLGIAGFFVNLFDHTELMVHGPDDF